MVAIKLGGLSLFVIAGALSIQSDLVADELEVGSWTSILSAVAVGFFAYAGFEVVANAAEDMDDPRRLLPRALTTAILIVIVVYVGIALVVSGALPYAELLASKDTAIAEAARPLFGQIGFTLMAVVAIVATVSAVNATLYGSTNVAYVLARDGRLPQAFGRRTWHNASEGLVLTGALVIALSILLDLSRVAGLASLVFLSVYVVVGLGHLRLRAQTGAHVAIIVSSVAATAVTLLVFAAHLTAHDPLVIAFFLTTIIIAVVVQAVLKRRHGRETPDATPTGAS